MAWPSKVLYADVTLGVYYTENFGGPADPQPTWAAVNTGLPNTLVKQLAVDPFDPTRQYVLLTDGTLHVREGGGAWSQILSVAQARTACGVASGAPWSFCCDLLVPGRLWFYLVGDIYGPNPCAARSDDYGATWAGGPVHTASIVFTRAADEIRSAGDFVVLGWGGRVIVSSRWIYSTNAGASWGSVILATVQAYTSVHVNPLEPTKVYGSTHDYGFARGIPVESLAAGSTTVLNKPGVIFHPRDMDRQWALAASGGTVTHAFYWTSDRWATAGGVTLDVAPGPRYAKCLCPWTDGAKFVFGLFEGGVAVKDGEASTTLVLRNGANTATPPYTDSIPDNGGGACWDGVQVVDEAEPPGAIRFHSVASDMPATVPVPMWGDRSAWRDIVYPTRHAEDIHTGVHSHHMDPANPRASQADLDTHIADPVAHGGVQSVDAIAAVALIAGDLVQLYDDSGTLTCSPADASLGRAAGGYVVEAYDPAETATVLLNGINEHLAGLTVAATLWLGTAGDVTETAPTTAGHIVQEVGQALSATEAVFRPQHTILLA